MDAAPALRNLATAVVSLVRRGQVGDLPSVPPLILALSGGSDSTGLLVALNLLRRASSFPLAALHVNYRLRGAESDGDQRFVEELCERLGVEISVHRVDDVTLAELQGAGTQEVARRIRRQALRLAADPVGGVVTLGHTRDDRVEGFFLGLLRGAGTEALGGMRLVSREGLFRPLLELGREEIRLWLRGQGVPWREDASNAGDAYLRNRIRHRLIPLFEELRPGAGEVLVRTQEILSRDGDCLATQADEAFAGLARAEPGCGLSLSLSGLAAVPEAVRARVLRSAVRSAGGGETALTRDATVELLELVARGREAQGWTRRRPVVSVSRGRLWFHPAAPTPYTVVLPAGGTVDVEGWRFRVTSLGAAEMGKPGADPERVELDCADVVAPLMVRTARAGERISGREGRLPTTVMALLGRAQIPGPLRLRWPLLADGRGILWVPGVGATNLVGPPKAPGRVLVVERVPSRGTSEDR